MWHKSSEKTGTGSLRTFDSGLERLAKLGLLSTLADACSILGGFWIPADSFEASRSRSIKNRISGLRGIVLRHMPKRAPMCRGSRRHRFSLMSASGPCSDEGAAGKSRFRVPGARGARQRAMRSSGHRIIERPRRWARTSRCIRRKAFTRQPTWAHGWMIVPTWTTSNAPPGTLFN